MENTPNLAYSALSVPQKYEHLHSFWKGIADDQVDWVANLSNASALMKEIFNWWWVGFYRIHNNQLILGPFQGPSACTKIDFGKGVCGTCWKNESTVLVPNVHEFEGHIACSSLSNSEIVIPIWKNDEIWGVLDIDSVEYNQFDEIDQQNLENFTNILSGHL